MDYKNYNDYELVYEIRDNNEDAYNILVEKYSMLINKYATEYYRKTKAYKLEYEDLVQEGYIGLLQALDSYDEKTCLFYTFASLCIKREMERHIKTFSRAKHMPLNDAISMNVPLNKGNDLIIEDVLESKENVEQDVISNITCSGIMSLKYDMDMEMAAVFELKSNKFNTREISTLLDLPRKKVENYLIQIKRIINRYLKTIE